MDGLPYFLPKSKVHIDITWNKDDNNWNVSVSPVILADYDCPKYLLKRNCNALFDDDISFEVGQNGLLQKINVSTTDKTVSSIGELITAAGNVLAFGAGLPTSALKIPAARKAPPEPPAPKPSAFHGDFDPDKQSTKPIELETPVIKVFVNKRDKNGNFILDDNGYPCKSEYSQTYPATFELTCKSLGLAPTERTDILPEAYPLRGMVETSIDERSKEQNVSINGIVVRIAVPYEITITKDGDVGEKQTAVIMLPDKQNYIFPLSRRYLVQDKTDVTLKDGMIQTIQQVRPSMVAGIVGIPKTILGALVPIPIQIKQSQINNLQATETLIKLKKDIKDLKSE